MLRIAVIAAGSFLYRAQRAPHASRELMTPGSLLLGNPGECFECGHEHGSGDRCVSFGYTPAYFERLAADAGIRGAAEFRPRRLPPLRDLSTLVARACAGLSADPGVPWEELSIRLAVQVVRLALDGSAARDAAASPSAIARVTKSVRRIEHHAQSGLTVKSLALEAGLTPFHFLRTFEHVTGVTPHQFVLRSRLRAAAAHLAAEPAKVLDIALDCGFGDISNFNRAFRREFGVSPRQYRRG
jgi:AraC-like DNA-binding protein